MVQLTSLFAWVELQSGNKLGNRQKKVYSCFIKKSPLCNQDVKEILGWEINQVTPRTNELVKLGLLAEDGKKKNNKTGKTCIYWRIT